MAKVQGQCEPRFEILRDQFKDNLDFGEELGASLCLNIDGTTTIDLWGGHADEARTKPWQENTITNVFSSSKTVTALAGLMLIDRGLLDLDERVAKYWPEFAANGKENVLVRHVLSHTSGVSGWEQQVTFQDCCDFEKAAALLAAQAPFWEPGTASGYHSLTMGFLVGKLCRIVDGRNLKDFIRQEISEQLGADFQLGCVEEDWHRYSPVIPPPPLPEGYALEPGGIPYKSLNNPKLDALDYNTEDCKRAEMGAANGHSNARAMAKVLSTVALGGEVDGMRLISQKTLDLIFQEQASGVDIALGTSIIFGIGFGLSGTGSADFDTGLPAGRLCFWGGWGGSTILIDLDRKLTLAYAMNKMSSVGFGNEAAKQYIASIYGILDAEATAADSSKT